MRALGTIADLSRPSWLTALDPRLKLACLLWVSTLSVLVDSLPALGVLCLVGLTLLSGLRLPRRVVGLLAAILATIVWGAVLSQGLFFAGVPRTRWLTIVPEFRLASTSFEGLHLYREGLAYGLAQSLRAVAVTMTGLAVCLSTSPDRLLAAVATWRVPAGIGFVTVAALRFVPTLLDEWSTVRLARRLRSAGDTLRREPFARRLREELQLLLPAMAAALRRASTLATSMTVRGFDATQRRTCYPPLEFRALEAIALVLLAAVWLAAVAIKLAYWLYLADLFDHPALRNLYDVAREWL